MRLRGVSVVYSDYGFLSNAGDVRALTDVSLDVQPGDKLGVMGRNGAGKSTLMRVMAGVLSPNSGAVDYQGMSSALLSLNAGFDPDLSGVHNVVMHGMLMGLSRREAATRVDAVLEMSELGDAIRRRVSTYSSGMRARLCFSTAINLDPDVLLLDEVFSVGDGEFREKSRRIMLDRFAAGKSIVLVTHSVQMIRTVCDRAIWLDDGRIRVEGKVEDVIAAYQEASSTATKMPLTSRRPG